MPYFLFKCEYNGYHIDFTECNKATSRPTDKCKASNIFIEGAQAY